MKKASKDKEFIQAPPDDPTCACSDCQFMKLITLEKIARCLEDEKPEIVIDKQIIERAAKPIRRMLEISSMLGL
jgi:quinolinate synthase